MLNNVLHSTTNQAGRVILEGSHLVEGSSPVQKVPQIASSKKSSETSLFLTLQLVKGCSGGPPIPDPILPVRAEYSSQGFSGESLPAALQGFQPSSKTSCSGYLQPVNSRQLLETSQKAKAFQDTQGCGQLPRGRECSLLSVALQVLCPGGLAVAESCVHLVR